MKNFFFFSLLLLHCASPLAGQEMSWIPSGYATFGGCDNQTDCDQNIVCYKLQYTPVTDGVLTSYTTGFFADCLDGETTLVENESCIMADNSRQTEACHQVGKILMNSSGNLGAGPDCTLVNGVPIILHQVCFQVADGEHVDITKDELTNLTTSIDIEATENLRGKTEYPTYTTYRTKNRQICAYLPGEIGIGVLPHEPQVTILNWTPTSETGLGRYRIERSTDEGATFQSIHTVKDRSFDLNKLTYELLDREAAYGYNHYRVVYEDEKGQQTISDIGSVYHYDGNFGATLYPNPVKELLQLKVNTGENHFFWTVYNEQGKVILNGREENIYATQIDVTKLKAGAYFLNVSSGDQQVSEQFVKVK